MPETVTLSELLEQAKQELELVAWTQGQDDAFGCDRFVMLASILRLIYQRIHDGRHCTPEEMRVVRGMQRSQDTERDAVTLISRMALLVAPHEATPRMSRLHPWLTSPTGTSSTSRPS